MCKQRVFWRNYIAFVILVALGFVGCGKKYEVEEDNATGPNPPAATIKDAVAKLDLRAFPMMKRATKSIDTLSNSTLWVTDGNVDEAVDFYVDNLSKLGWKLSREPELAKRKEQSGASLAFVKDGYRLNASMSVVPPSTKMDVTLLYLGNIDVRKLPRYKDSHELTSRPDYVHYAADAKLEVLREFVRKEYTKLGWKEIKDPAVNDAQVIANGDDIELKFVQNDVALKVTVKEFGGKNSISTTVELVDKELEKMFK